MYQPNMICKLEAKRANRTNIPLPHSLFPLHFPLSLYPSTLSTSSDTNTRMIHCGQAAHTNTQTNQTNLTKHEYCELAGNATSSEYILAESGTCYLSHETRANAVSVLLPASTTKAHIFHTQTSNPARGASSGQDHQET